MDDPAVLALAGAVRALTTPIRVELSRDPEAEVVAETVAARGSGITARLTSRQETIPCLIDQLVLSVSSSTSRGQRSAAGVAAPINLAAAALVAEIEYTTRWGVTAWVGRQPATLRQQLSAWASRSGMWRVSAPGYLDRVSALAADWVTEIEALLDPDRSFRPVRDTYCPSCEAWHVIENVDGERRRTPALVVDTNTGSTRCRNCNASWDPAHAEWLARVLAQQRASGQAQNDVLG